MKILNMEQGSVEWQVARLGIPTASRADRILTPAKLQPSSQQRAFIAELVAEWKMQVPLDEAGSVWIERGNQLEQDAIAWYEFEFMVDVDRVGLCLSDDELFAASPDGLVGEDGGLEIKTPGAKTHMLYTLWPDDFKAKYTGQVQSSLWLTGRKWWDLVSYNPVLEPVRIRCEPDRAYQEAFEEQLASFLANLVKVKERYQTQEQ